MPDHYDFADFKGASNNWKLKSSFSEIPLGNVKLKIYDGLSYFLIQLDMAKEFDYDGLYAVSCGTRQSYLTTAAGLNG